MTDDSILCHERLAIVGVGTSFSFYSPPTGPFVYHLHRRLLCQRMQDLFYRDGEVAD